MQGIVVGAGEIKNGLDMILAQNISQLSRENRHLYDYLHRTY